MNRIQLWYTVFTSDMRHRDSLYCMAITSVYTIDNYNYYHAAESFDKKTLTNPNFNSIDEINFDGLLDILNAV